MVRLLVLMVCSAASMYLSTSEEFSAMESEELRLEREDARPSKLRTEGHAHPPRRLSWLLGGLESAVSRLIGDGPAETEHGRAETERGRSGQPRPYLRPDEKLRILNGVGYGDSSYNPVLGYYIGNLPPLARLHLPSLNLMDASQGVRTARAEMIGQVTVWPCSLAVGSTWDARLVRAWGVSLGDEFLAKGVNLALGPGVNIARIARGGRNAEYIGGESAHLASKLGVQYIEGIQSRGVRATIKHFAFNTQETNRNYYNAQVEERTAFEVYYPPFEAAARAGVASFMCAYNLVNGTYACGSKSLLTRDLRERMGFAGFVMSDWWAVHDFAYQNAGLDLLMPGNSHAADGGRDYFSPAALEATSEPGVVDGASQRVLGQLVKLSATCTPPHCDHMLIGAVATSPEHVALARTIARESVVLLKNEGGVLPLWPGMRVALLGSACDAHNDIDAMLAQWDLGNYYVIGGSGRTIPLAPVSVAAGLRAVPSVEVVNDWFPDNVALAHAAMEGADVAIVCGATTAAESRDRPSLLLDHDDFIGKVLELATIPTVVLMMTPGAVVAPWADKADAILNIFLAGLETGHALADVLTGATNPSGKLPLTIPLDESQTILPCGCNATACIDFAAVSGKATQGGAGGPRGYYNCSFGTGIEALRVGYLALTNQPVGFPFGHGLSYSRFDYSWAVLPPSAFGAHSVKFAVHVAAASGPESGGREVVQLYLSFPDSAEEPERQLKGFAKTGPLAPGRAGETVSMPLDCRDLSVWRVDRSGWAAVPGTFRLWVGSSSRDVRLETSFMLPAGVCP